MTGAELKAYRVRLGLSRPALAQRAGLSASAVKYWERKPRVNVLGVGPKMLLDVLGLADIVATAHAERISRMGVIIPSHTRAWGRVLFRGGGIALRRVTCGAKTRKGTPCRAMSEPCKRRCRFHGGKSTGPKTPEGRERIADAQRRRWANHRSAKTQAAVE